MPIKETAAAILALAAIVNYVRSVVHRSRGEHGEAAGAKLDTIAALILLGIVLK